MIFSYAITDPQYYGDNPHLLHVSIEKLLCKKVDFICFRDKESASYELLAQSFILTCKDKNFQKSLLHGDVQLACKLGAYGVHLSSKQFSKISNAKKQGLFCVVSTHNEEEIHQAMALGADAVTYSPIFSTPNKGIPKGLEDLKEKVAKINIKIIALGGIISDKQIAEIESTNAFAFASIRYFID